MDNELIVVTADRQVEQQDGGEKVIEPEVLPAPPQIDEDSRYTDHGNALRFVTYFSAIAFFHHILKSWFVWVDTHWKRDTTNLVTSYAIEHDQAYAEDRG